jgi:hypothetical protein
LITTSFRPAFHYRLVCFLLCLTRTFSKLSFSFPSLRLCYHFPLQIVLFLFLNLFPPRFYAFLLFRLSLSRFLCCLSCAFSLVSTTPFSAELNCYSC